MTQQVVANTTFMHELHAKAVSEVVKKFGIANPHQFPFIDKIIVSMRLGKDASDKKAIEAAINELTLITGQKPAYSKAKKSISSFKLRQGQIIGAFTTLRGRMADDFLTRLIYLALPRIRDFRGFYVKSFDADFNLTIGIKEHSIFQELTYDQIYKSRGMDITLAIKNATSVDMAFDLLRMINFPIKKS
jgi:large subunit ribosomal protein L5